MKPAVVEFLRNATLLGLLNLLTFIIYMIVGIVFLEDKNGV
jgi:hypothetical protein